MQESIYYILLAQQDKIKNIWTIKLIFSDDFDFYLNKIIAPITNDKNGIDTHSTSKLLSYDFNNLRLDLNENTYKIRHAIILNDQYVLEVSQSSD